LVCIRQLEAGKNLYTRIAVLRANESTGGYVARKTVLISDMSGQEIGDGKGATIRITFHDARKGVRELDVTDSEADKLGGRQVARRGRRPKSAG
jgi:hypothetical protein